MSSKLKSYNIITHMVLKTKSNGCMAYVEQLKKEGD